MSNKKIVKIFANDCPEPKVVPLKSLFCPTISSQPKDIQFHIFSHFWNKKIYSNLAKKFNICRLIFSQLTFSFKSFFYISLT